MEDVKLIESDPELLEDQKEIEPVVYVDKYKCCSNCGHNLEIQFWLSKNIMLHVFRRICPGCGRPVKWND